MLLIHSYLPSMFHPLHIQACIFSCNYYIINECIHISFGCWCMVFSATFNDILVISWWLVLLVEETGVPVASH